MTARFIPVPEGLAGERLDVAMVRMLGMSRASAAELITAGEVLVDGRVVDKAHRLSIDAVLEINEPRPHSTPPQVESEVVLPVVFEDADIIVVDKPVGVAAHPSVGWTGPTVTGALTAAGFVIATSGAAERQGIVHRLDVGTSGLMVVARSERAYSHLKAQFKARTVDKTYHALAQGIMDPFTGTIDAPIGRHPGADYKFAVVAGGKPSVTHYHTLEAFGPASLLEVHLQTGRTHQIRVHCAAMRHPLAGDITYGADPVMATRLGLRRQWLHAVRLGFTHPGGQEVTFESTYPIDLEQALVTVTAGIWA